MDKTSGQCKQIVQFVFIGSDARGVRRNHVMLLKIAHSRADDPWRSNFVSTTTNIYGDQ